MTVVIQLRRSFAALVPLAAVVAAGALVLPGDAAARRNETHGEARVTRSEERSAREQEKAARAQERVVRAQEREARRAARENERGARDSSGAASGEATSPPLEGGGNTAASEAGAQLSSKAERGCTVSMRASAARVTAGETVNLSGALECPSSAAAAGQQIAIYTRQAGTHARTFTMLATVTTEADGSYQLTSPALDANTIFQARAGRHQAHAAVRVVPLVTIAAAPPPQGADAASAHTRTRGTFTGTISPVIPGTRVTLQIANAASGEHWRSVAVERAGADGSYAIAHTFRAPGAASVRTVVHAGRSAAVAVSETLLFEVAQPQNPQLTITSSSDPLRYEESTTISGVAPAGPVTLLARVAGGSFVTVASATAEASGAYTFTVAPLANTEYRVTAGTLRSTTLFEGVALTATSVLAPSTITAGGELTLSGTLNGAAPGQVVDLEREYASGVGFQIIASGAVDASAQFTISHVFASAGADVLRLKVPGDSRHLASVSAPLSVTVTS